MPAKIRQPSSLMTSGEVARAIGVSEKVVTRWGDEQLLPYCRLPSKTGNFEHRRYRSFEVVAFCRENNLPFHFDGLDEPALGGAVVLASRDQRLIDALHQKFILHHADCSAEAGYQVARLLPGQLILDTAVVPRYEAREAASYLHRRIPRMRIGFVLGDDDPGEGYPEYVRCLGRPFGSEQILSVLT